MTQAEANAMDPQHRMLLEITYEAMENGEQYMNSGIDNLLTHWTSWYSHGKGRGLRHGMLCRWLHQRYHCHPMLYRELLLTYHRIRHCLCYRLG